MKLPRWLIVSMLTASALALLGAGAWWWVTWPERTAVAFVHLMCDERFEEARSIAHIEESFFRPMLGWNAARIVRVPRSVPDVILGRQQFKLPVNYILTKDGSSEISNLFIAERGAIVEIRTATTPVAMEHLRDLSQ
jgi:hypothetical protein